MVFGRVARVRRRFGGDGGVREFFIVEIFGYFEIRDVEYLFEFVVVVVRGGVCVMCVGEWIE